MANFTRTQRNTPLYILCTALILTLTACESNQPTSSLDQALSAYNASDYANAQTAAESVARSSSGETKTRANYLAGMSAFKLNRTSQAQLHLTKVTSTSDREAAANANATLGLIAAQQGRHPQAIQYLTVATKTLKGDDLANAYYHLALSEQKLGYDSTARTHFELANKNASNSNLRNQISDRRNTSGWTIQLGAFSSKNNADRHAISSTTNARSAGLTSPLVVPANVSGRNLYLVQVGRFSTYTAALAARTKLNRSDAIVQSITN